jgi:hypothetical protein
LRVTPTSEIPKLLELISKKTKQLETTTGYKSLAVTIKFGTICVIEVCALRERGFADVPFNSGCPANRLLGFLRSQNGWPEVYLRLKAVNANLYEKCQGDAHCSIAFLSKTAVRKPVFAIQNQFI